MRKGVKILPLIFLIAIVLTAVSCQQLKVDNLRANEHFKKANKYYTEEKFKRAATEYEAALALNSELKQAYKFLGTAYATLYKMGDESEENVALGEKAQAALKRAQEYEPDDPKVILALGQLSDKMKNFEEAEAQYLKVLNQNPKNADMYIILADFYKSYDGKEDKVLEMYDKRIQLNADDPDAYLYPAKYFFDRKKWDDSLRYHDLRVGKIEQSTTLDEKAKREKLADAYYRMGHLCWAHSYQTPADMMGANERTPIIDRGMEMLTKATEINPTAPDPWVYLGLLWLEKDKIDPARHDLHQQKRDELVKKYQDLVKQKKANEELFRNLQREEK